MLDYQNLKNQPFIIAGPCIIESEEHVLKMAKELKNICQQLNLNLIFKASFDKANRTSINSYRGPGIEKGLKILKKVKQELNLSICTDVHTAEQCQLVAQVADIIQIPAFLCRQTDLLLAAGQTNCIINLKKGQFCSPETMIHAVNKIKSTGNHQIILCDRGTMFGYGELIVDFRGLTQMRINHPDLVVIQDITHSLQKPNQSNRTLGEREMIPTIGRAAMAVGVNGIFMEVHDDPEAALSDATTQWPLHKTKELLEINKATQAHDKPII